MSASTSLKSFPEDLHTELRPADIKTGCTALEPYVDFDAVRSRSVSPEISDSDWDSDDDVDRQTSGSVADKRAQTELLIITLIEKLCLMYDSDPTRSARMFQKICEQMQGTGMISAVSFRDNTAEIRARCQRGFFGLFEQTFASVFLEDERMRFGESNSRALALVRAQQRPSNCIDPNTLDVSALPYDPSVMLSPGFGQRLTFRRFHIEFEVKRTIGRGGFGRVLEAHNKLDGVSYAVKVITMNVDAKSDDDTADKILREVIALAVLDHPNVVRYNGSWIEYDFVSRRTNNHYEEIDESRGVFDSSSEYEQDQSWSRQDRFEFCSDREGESSDDERSEESQVGSLDISNGSSILFASSNGSAGGSSVEEVFPASRQISKNYPPSSMQPVLKLYIQMQLCERSLHDWLEDRKLKGNTINLAEASSLFLQIVDGVVHVHENGLIHRDIKPQNIFLKEVPGELPIVKLGDFGLAVDNDTVDYNENLDNEDASPENSANSTTSRRTSQCHTTGVGTGTYASPEQLNNASYDKKADIYSLGMVLFELLSRFETGMERIEKMKNARVRDLPLEFVKEFPQQSALILWYTEALPENRPTAKEVLESFPASLPPNETTGPVNSMVGRMGKQLAEATASNIELVKENNSLREELAAMKAELVLLKGSTIST